jgi:hypothetical protein
MQRRTVHTAHIDENQSRDSIRIGDPNPRNRHLGLSRAQCKSPVGPSRLAHVVCISFERRAAAKPGNRFGNPDNPLLALHPKIRPHSIRNQSSVIKGAERPLIACLRVEPPTSNTETRRSWQKSRRKSNLRFFMRSSWTQNPRRHGDRHKNRATLIGQRLILGDVSG